MTADKLCAQALKGGYIGTPYSKLDCQGLIKRILLDAGEKHSAKGSNYMWRYWLSEWGTLPGMTLCPGMLVFTVKNDGGEVARGYHDSRGNAAHVGLLVDESRVMHSSSGGVQWASVTDKRWTHAGKMLFVDYCPAPSNDNQVVTLLKEALKIMERRVESDD